jgi:HEAT repeat protein
MQTSNHPRRHALAVAALVLTACAEDTATTESTLPEVGAEDHLRGLLSSDPVARATAFAAFRRGWEHLRGDAAKLIESEDLSIRLAGAQLFAQLAHEPDLPAVRRLLLDESIQVALTVAPAAVRLRDPGSADAFEGRLQRAAYDDLPVLLAAMIACHEPRGLSRARALATHDDWAIRRAAALALAEVRAPAARPLVETLLGDSVWRVQADAATAAGARRDAQVRPQLTALLAHDELAVRSAAVTALGQIADAADCAAIGELAGREENEDCLRNAAKALSAFPGGAGIPYLAGMLTKPGADDAVLEEVAEQLVKIGSPEARAVLERASKSEDEELRHIASEALAGSPAPR